MAASIFSTFLEFLRDIVTFSDQMGRLRLRQYQVEVAQAVIDSVVHRRGLTFVVVFPRQSGKNELQAQIETYLLTLYSERDAEIIKVSPTWKPQSLNAMRRLQRVLERNLVTWTSWRKESGYIYKIGSARIFFLSGGLEANIVGATASTLLEVDEAQDVSISKFDKDINPMAASTNATKVFWGTAWTSNTLLARELRAAKAAQERDGIRRVFVCSAEDVGREVPAFAVFVAEQVAKLGRNHPMVKSQFFSEEIDAEGGLFPPTRRALMQGLHKRKSLPDSGRVYAFLLDLAGEDEKIAEEGGVLQNPGRDATALTIVEVDLKSCSDPLVKAPTYTVLDRRLWVGVKHTTLYQQIMSLAGTWRPYYLVVDATGVGAGLASFLDKALPGRVLPYLFNSKTKSELGWNFLAVVETGRFKDWWNDGHWDEHNVFWQQLENCQSEIVPGPDRKMKWGVPDGMRDPATGELMHDDLLISAALCAALDEQEWPSMGGAAVVRAADPLEAMEREEAF